MPKGHPANGYSLTPQRATLLHILATEGPIEDRDGLLVGRLAERLGYRITQTLSMLIKSLESAGLIKRDVAGRRTYRLEIVPCAVAMEHRTRLGM
jgi:DNA-binding MarR family transcriptional regulator